MLSYSWKNETCPYCGSTGNCSSCGSYTRGIADFINGKAAYGELCIQRLSCSSCGHTHAVLPDFIVPYSTYGLFFILRVLAEYFLHLKPVQALCARFGISVSMLYRWKALFLSQKQQWMGALESEETPPLSFIRSLCTLGDYSQSFSCLFVLLATRSFMQSHKNPADHCQKKF